MNEKKKTTNKTTREALLKGVNNIADTVKVTLGAKGKTVLFNKHYDFEDTVGRPVITKDGVTVAKEVKSEDPYENMAIQIVRQSAQNTVSTSGDGTTTTMILAQYLINNGLKLMDEGLSPWEFNKHADKAVEEIIESIKDYSTPIDGDLNKLLKVATVSANDEKIGKLIHNIIKEIGFDGDIELKETKNEKTMVETVKGMRLHKGYFANFMVSDFTKMDWRQEDVFVLIFDGVIRDFNDIIPYIKVSVDEQGIPVPLLVFVKDVAPTALQRIKQWHQMSQNHPFMIVEMDGMGERREELMDDVCILTGCSIVNPKDRPSDPHVAAEKLGYCREAIVTKRFTSLIEGDFNEDLLNEQIDMIKDKLENADLSLNEQKFYKKRLANLSGGVAIIHVGGQTKVEMEEAYARIEDAALATKAAIRQGVTPGGGYVFLNIANSLNVSPFEEFEGENTQHATLVATEEVHKAKSLVYASLEEPVRQLLKNAHIEHEFSRVKSAALSGKAYDLLTSRFYDTKSYPIYDAASVLIDSLVNSVAVAKSILSIERSIHNGNVLK